MDSSVFDRWFVSPASPADARIRLFCIPYAGGSASHYRSWSDGFPRTVDVRAVQFPGRQKRVDEPRFRRLQPAVEGIVAALGAIDRPYAFFGDCTGAFIALEVCRSLRRQGYPAPRHLFIACCRAPHLPLDRTLLHKLDDDALREELRQLGLVPGWLLDRDDYYRAFLPLLRDDFELAETYVHGDAEPFSFPITAFAGRADPVTSVDEVDAWRVHTSGRFTARILDGGHDLTKTHVVQIVDEVFRALQPEFESEIRI